MDELLSMKSLCSRSWPIVHCSFVSSMPMSRPWMLTNASSTRFLAAGEAVALVERVSMMEMPILEMLSFSSRSCWLFLF